jgi:hypothetical protein
MTKKEIAVGTKKIGEYHYIKLTINGVPKILETPFISRKVAMKHGNYERYHLLERVRTGVLR